MFKTNWIAPAMAGILMAAGTVWGQETIRVGEGPDGPGPQTVIVGGGGAGPMMPPVWINRAITTQPSMIKAAYLGVSASPAGEPLRTQLKLDKGVGLVVEYVEPSSPADEAGIKRFDVLEKFEDQLLINPQQLEVLLRLHKPGESVKLQLIHEGKPVTLAAKLTEKEVIADEGEENTGPGTRGYWLSGGGSGPAGMMLPAPPGAVPGMIGFAPNVPNVYTDGKYLLVIQDANGQPQLRATDVPSGNVVFVGPVGNEKDIQAMPREVLIRFRAATGTGLLANAGSSVVASATGKDQMLYSDGRYLLVKSTKDGKEYLHAIEVQSGKVIFDGPVSTAEERKAVPAEIAEQFKAMMRPAATQPMLPMMMPPPKTN